METKINPSKITVEIWSDIMCPFCYIGKRNFENALQVLPFKDHVEIIWKSFQLDPSIPDHVSDSVYEYLAKMKGMSLEQSIGLHQNVTETARRVGLKYNFDEAKIANSMKAHQLIQLAKTNQLGNEMEELLFEAYFTKGKNISNDEVLIQLGSQIGLSEDAIKDAIYSTEFKSKVLQDIEEAKNVGVRGVPFFVMNRKYAVSGAQPTSVFIDTLNEIMNEFETVEQIPTNESNVSCSINGEC